MAKFLISWVWESPETWAQTPNGNYVFTRPIFGSQLTRIEPINGKYIWDLKEIEKSIKFDQRLYAGRLTILAINILPES